MVSRRRRLALPALSLSLSLIGTGASAASVSCASVAQDPNSLLAYQDMAGFQDVINALAANCPEVLDLVVLPPDIIVPQFVTPITIPDDEDEPAPTLLSDQPSAEELAAARKVAALNAAATALKQAVQGVQLAEARVDRALGQVQSLSRLAMTDTALQRMTLADIAQARRDAKAELRAARADLAVKNKAYDSAVVQAKQAIAAAQTAQTAADTALNAVTNGSDAKVLLEKLTKEAATAEQALVEFDAKAKGVKDDLTKVQAYVTRLTGEITTSVAELDKLKAGIAVAKQAVYDAEIAMKAGTGTKAAVEAAMNEVWRINDALVAEDTKLGGLNKSLAEANVKTDSLNKAMAEFELKRPSYAQAAEKAVSERDTLSGLVKAADAAKQTMDSTLLDTGVKTQTAKDAAAAALTRLNEALDHATTLTSLNAQEQALLDEAKAAAQDLSDATEQLDTSQSTANAALDAVEKTDPDAVHDAASALEEMADMADGVEESAEETQSDVDGQIEAVTEAIDALQEEITPVTD